MTQWFVAVDGGATKCVVRIENEFGGLIGREITGTANIQLSPSRTWHEILLAMEKILSPLGISYRDKQHRFHAVMGLAGCEVSSAYEAFIQTPHNFRTLTVTSDAEIACLGAHGGEDGAIIIIGTGVVGFKKNQNQKIQLSGYGFPHDDRGGGAYLGCEAVYHTFTVKDGINPPGLLSEKIYARFQYNWTTLIEWATQSNATAFATLAPIVIQCAQLGDVAAICLMQQAARSLDQIATALLPDKTLPLSLIGGVAPFMTAYLPKWHPYMRPALKTPDEGAMMLLRQKIMNANDLPSFSS